MSDKFSSFIVSSFAQEEGGGMRVLHLNRNNGELVMGTAFGDGQVFYCAVDTECGCLYSLRAKAFNKEDGQEELCVWSYRGPAKVPELLGKTSTGGRGTCFVGITPGGGPILLAHYGSAALTLVHRGPGGKLSANTDKEIWNLAGSSINPKRQLESHPHCFISSSLSEKGVFALYAADLGSDRIWCYRYHSESRSIKALHSGYVKAVAGSGPRHIAIHPDGGWLYCLDELSNTLSVYSRNSRTGDLAYQKRLSTTDKDLVDSSFCGDLVITLDGRFLYATNRGDNSIASFDVSDGGSPNLKKILPTGYAGPQNLAISLDGKWLLCAHMPGNRVVSYEIDQASGMLKPIGNGMEMTSPSCLCEI